MKKTYVTVRGTGGKACEVRGMEVRDVKYEVYRYGVHTHGKYTQCVEFDIITRKLSPSLPFSLSNLSSPSVLSPSHSLFLPSTSHLSLSPFTLSPSPLSELGKVESEKRRRLPATSIYVLGAVIQVVLGKFLPQNTQAKHR